ncbi:hypothetical protein BC937DRAFT_86564 [Endogone sp. FLAS-F59071]|nr:hypothetical protein BC937DRAFT_86564 [Endogone sp. FLAS-F59071]|eukprot:RUS20003.1 hypothetical protein BC937DRAFT_86564 [Endogone sp. FLAS-F59071]
MNYNLDNPFPLASAKYSGPGSLQQGATPYLARSALSERERDVYRSWFNELDPFSTGASVSNTAVLQFLTNAYLPAETLGKIFAFFDSAHDGLSESQFYAILRLVAHAQNGRTITRDLVFIEPPVPRFQLQPIDAYLKSSLRSPTSTPFSPSLSPNTRPNIKGFASLSANPTTTPSHFDDASLRTTNSQQLAQSWMFNASAKPNAPAKPNPPNPVTTNGIDLLGEFVPAPSAPAKSTSNWWESLVTEPSQPTSAATAVLSPSLNRPRTPQPLETSSNSYFPPAQLIQTPMSTSPQAGISPNNPFFNAANNARTTQSPSTGVSSPNNAAFTSVTTTVSALKAEEPAFFSKRFSTGSIDPRTHNQRQQALLTQQRQDLLSLYPVLSPKSEPDKPKSPAPKPSSLTNERTTSPTVTQSPTSSFSAFAPKPTDATAVASPTSASPPPLPQRASFDPDSFKRLMMTARRLTDDIPASPTDAQNPFTALRQIAEGSVGEGGSLASPTRGPESPGLKDGGGRQRPSMHSRESSGFFADLADFGMGGMGIGTAAGVTLGQAQAQSPVSTSAPVTASPSSLPPVAAISSPPSLPTRQSFTAATISPLPFATIPSSPPPVPPRQPSATTILPALAPAPVPAPAPALAPVSPILQSILSPGPEFPFDERFPDINALESAAALTIPADSPTPSSSPTPKPVNILPNKQGAPAPPLPSQITKPIVLKYSQSTSPISNSPPQATATVLDVLAPIATRPPPLLVRPRVGSGSSSPLLSTSPAAFLQQQQRIYSPVPFTQSPQPIGIATSPALPSRSPARTPKAVMQMPKQPSLLGTTGAWLSTDNSGASPRAPPSSALEELQRDLAYLQKDQEALARRAAGGVERRG